MTLLQSAAARQSTTATSAPASTLAAAGLISIAVIHLLDLPGKEPTYLAILYLALIAVCVALSLRLAVRPTSMALAATVLIALATMAAYAVSRTTGLPAATDDVGDWLEPLGMAAMACEATTAGFAALALLVSPDR